MSQIKDPDELANLWNKTKDPKYKKLWYKTVKGNTMDIIILNDGLYHLIPITKKMLEIRVDKRNKLF